MQLNIRITVHHNSDLVDALEQVTAMIREYYGAGENKDDTSSFKFTLIGNRVKNYAIAKKGNYNYLSKKRFLLFEEAQENASLNKNGGDVVCGVDSFGEVIKFD